MSYDKMKYTDPKKRRQNINDARNYFNINLAKEETILHEDMFNSGIRWFEKGRSLEIAPKVLLNNSSFKYGYEYAKRQRNIQIYELGYRHYIDGGSVEDIPLEYKDNNFFREGFENAMKDSLKNNDVKKGPKR